MAAPTVVTVAMLTYLRPQDIAVGLPLIIEQVKRVNTVMDVNASILVVDNDADGSARAWIESLEEALVRYVIEPSPGIAAARNRVLDETAGLGLLVFIDDDERPHQGWLQNLIQTQANSSAAAVAGAVVSEFDGELDTWVAAGAFFQRRRLQTGTAIDVAATNNLLLDLAQVRRLNLRFDARFGLTGAEDTLFTRTLAVSGATMVWCDEAIVTDFVPAARMTRKWVLRRAFSSGNAAVLTTTELGGTKLRRAGARLNGVRNGILRLVGGGARNILGLVLRSPHHQTRGLRSAFRGLGMMAGALGLGYQEYGRGHRGLQRFPGRGKPMRGRNLIQIYRRRADRRNSTANL